jgi:murein endopeptidase
MAVALRTSLLLPLSLAVPDVTADESGFAAPTPELVQVDEGEPSLSLAIIPHETHPRVNLERVRWTVPRREKLERLADRWGLHPKALRELNPELDGNVVDTGQALVVHRKMPDVISRSIGAPNRGRIEHSVPFPEGSAWALRPWRARAWGTEHVVTHLMVVFDDFKRRFPDASPIVVGELSSRSGGKIRPHSSHQSGRDVDLGYVVDGPPPPNGRWPRVRVDDFDAERNWALVRGLLGTGEVERIFIDARLQRKLLEVASSDIPDDELDQWFSVAATSRRAASRAVIGHWAGHDDHMHVRFRCSPADVRCDAEPAPKKKRRRVKRRTKRKRARSG